MRTAFVRRCLEHPWLPVVLAFLAMLLCVQALHVGWLFDDYFLRAALDPPEQLSEAARSPAELFAWSGEHWVMPRDLGPWWTSDELAIAFARPLTGYSHWLDHRLWPDEPFWAHLHSLLWRGLLVLTAGLLFRRLASPGELRVAGLATLIFALDDAFAIPTIWISNRNALLALFFGLLTLLAYHRWRHDGWRAGAVAAPAALALAVLSSEAAVACGAFLVSYAMFLDRGPSRQRWLALAPCAAVGVVWAVAYRALGYGARGSLAYIDLGERPLRFLAAVMERGPIALWGQLGFPPPDGYIALSQVAARQSWWLAVVLLAVFGLLLTPLLRRDRRARFWTFGMVAALPLSCAMFPHNRLLGYVSLGAAGLLAIFFVRAWQPRNGSSSGWRAAAGRWTLRFLTVPLLLIHLGLNPFVAWSTAKIVAGLNTFLVNAAATLPSDSAVREQKAVVVTLAGSYLTFYASSYQALQGRAIPREILALATSAYPVEVHRPDARSLTVRPEGGFLLPPGSEPPGKPQPRSSFNYFLQSFDTVFQDGEPFEAGQRIERRRVDIEIDAVADDGRPAVVTFRFDADLEDPSWRWLRWESGGFVAWQPPAVGETVTVSSW